MFNINGIKMNLTTLRKTLYAKLVDLGLISKDGVFIKNTVLSSDGFLDLHIETLEGCEDRSKRSQLVVSFAHYVRQNGDMMRDPDVEFGINHDTREVNCLTFRNDLIGYFDDVMESGELNTSMEQSISEFFWIWLNNIEMQGFTKGLKDVKSKMPVF